MSLQALVFPIPQLYYITASTTLRGGNFEETGKWNSKTLTGGPTNTVFYMDLLASLAHDNLTAHLSPNSRERLPQLRADAFWQRLVLLRTKKSNPLQETPLGRKARLLHPDLDPQEPLIFIGVDERQSALSIEMIDTASCWAARLVNPVGGNPDIPLTNVCTSGGNSFIDTGRGTAGFGTTAVDLNVYTRLIIERPTNPLVFNFNGGPGDPGLDVVFLQVRHP